MLEALAPLHRRRMHRTIVPSLECRTVATLLRRALLVLSLFTLSMLHLPTLLAAEESANVDIDRTAEARSESVLGDSGDDLRHELLAASNRLHAPVLAADSGTLTKFCDDLCSDLSQGKVSVEPYGILWGDMIFSSSRAVPGPFVLWIASQQDQGESTYIADARRSRVGIDVVGPELNAFGGLASGGKVEIDFFDTFINENQPGLRLRHAYWEAKNDNLRLLVGQTWDVISPLRPSTVNFSVGWAAGNVGFRRTQFRLERYLALGGGDRLILQGSLNQNIIPDLASGPQAEGVIRETGDWPMIQARLAYHRNRGDCGSAEFGVSGHVGETGFDFTTGHPANPALGPQDDARFFGWSFGADGRIDISKRLRFQSEFFMGSNLSNILGGIGQGVCPCLRIPIRSIGGWAEVSYDLNSYLTINSGFGIDDPRDIDSLIGRTYNRFVYINLFVNFTQQLRTGLELSSWRTGYHNRTSEPGFTPIASPTEPGKATVIDWTVQYRF